MKLRYENRDMKDCSLVNLSVESFNLPNTTKGRSVTENRIVLKRGDFWMDLVGNGNNVIGNYKVRSSGIPAYYDCKEKAYFGMLTASNRVLCFASMAPSLIYDTS